MKIGLVIYGRLDTLSGGYLYDRQMAAALRQRGHRVAVVSLPAGPYALRLALNRRVNWLAARMPERDVPEIYSYIVFVREGVELDVAGTPVPVLEARQLKGAVRRIERDRSERLEEAELYEIERAMLGSRIDEL